MCLLAHAKSRREQAETILRDNEMVLALPRLTEEAFERYPMSLPLSGSFYERDIPYTYQEYLELKRANLWKVQPQAQGKYGKLV